MLLLTWYAEASCLKGGKLADSWQAERYLIVEVRYLGACDAVRRQSAFDGLLLRGFGRFQHCKFAALLCLLRLAAGGLFLCDACLCCHLLRQCSLQQAQHSNAQHSMPHFTTIFCEAIGLPAAMLRTACSAQHAQHSVPNFAILTLASAYRKQCAALTHVPFLRW